MICESVIIKFVPGSEGPFAAIAEEASWFRRDGRIDTRRFVELNVASVPESHGRLVAGKPSYKFDGMISIAITLITTQTTATMPVYPSTSPNFSRVTVRIGIAQNGCMKLVVASP